MKNSSNNSRNLYSQNIYNQEHGKSLGSFKKAKKTSYYDKLFNRKQNRKSMKDSSGPISTSLNTKSKEKITPSVATINLMSQSNDA